MRLAERLRGLLWPLAVVSVSGAAVALVVISAGYDIGAAVGAAVDGALGSPYAVVSATLKRMTPLLFLGIAVAVAFRAGVLNIGAEGQFLVGAAAAAVAGLQLAETLGPITPAAMLLAGAVAGSVWAGIAAWLRQRYNVTEVVSTLLLNFVATNLIGFLIRGPMQEPTQAYPQSALIADVARLPLVVEGQRLHVGFVIALALAGASWWALRNTAAGFRLRAVGASPSAARSAGLIDANRVQASALVVSGAVAGLAGACELSGVTFALYEGLSPGYGYAAIGVALLGGLNPLGIIAAAFFFGALGAGADAMQREAAVPAEFASVVAAVVVLGVLAVPGPARLASGERTRRALR